MVINGRKYKIEPGADLRWANLTGADLYRADLAEADLTGADLRWANLTRADLYRANLIRANLIRANLHRADLRWADLRWADLHGANLNGADLTGADLRWADLHGADLHGANLNGADLTGADLGEAKINDFSPIEDVKKKLLELVENQPPGWMGNWEIADECGTTKCLAGHLASMAEVKIKSDSEYAKVASGVLLASGIRKMPNFYGSDEEAMDWLREGE